MPLFPRSYLVLIAIVLVITVFTLVAVFYLQKEEPKTRPKTGESILIRGETAFTQDLDVFDTAAVVLVKSEKIDTKKHEPIKSLVNYQVNDKTLLWQTKDFKQALVDQDFFSDLNVIDATNLNKEFQLGKAKKALMENYAPAKTIRFLLESEIIRTYVHLEATLTLVETVDNEAVYEEHYDAVHSYCTNECIDEAYSFAVQLNKASGEITVKPNSQ